MISSVGSQNFVSINKTLQKSSDKHQTNKTDEVLADDKLSKLSEQIKNGKYQIDTHKTSLAVAKELIG